MTNDIFEHSQEELEMILTEVALQTIGMGIITSENNDTDGVLNAYFTGQSLFVDLYINGELKNVIRFNLENQEANLFTSGKKRLLSLKGAVLLELIYEKEGRSIDEDSKITNLISEGTKYDCLRDYLIAKSFSKT
jgi:hypothetical protein